MSDGGVIQQPKPGISDEEKYRAVWEYVMRKREKEGIIPRVPPDGSWPEGSCEMQGEFYNLVEVQLTRTVVGHGAWRELRFPEILDGAFRYVTEGCRG